MLDYQIALLLHVLGAVGIVGGSVLEHVVVARLKRVRTTDQMGEWLTFATGLSRAMPVFALVILLAGLYMTITRWGFGIPWIDISLVLLVALGASAPLVLDPHIKALARAVKAGEPIERVRARLHNTAYTITSNVFTSQALAIVALMTLKPNLVWSLVIVIASAVIGIALAFAERSQVQPPTETTSGRQAGEQETVAPSTGQARDR